MNAKVSIVITAHNYAKYLPQALDSALRQNFLDFEVVVVNDGSTDHTAEVLSHYAGNDKVKIINTPGLGLAAASNLGIRSSHGDYIVRLDADDYFDENLLLVEATYLDNHPNIGLVFCDYYTVDAHGDIIDRVRRAKVSDEVELLDRPALAAGAMYRRRCYETVGGYNETLRYQEDYDFWLKFIEKFQVRNVSLPLMFYRQHGGSMSRNWTARMATRRQVKAKFAREHRAEQSLKILAVIPARGDVMEGTKLPMLALGGKTLLAQAIEKLQGVDLIDRVIVSTDDEAVADAALSSGAEVPYLRPPAFRSPSVTFETVLLDLLRTLHKNEEYKPDVVVILHLNAPFVQREQITEAIDTMLLFNSDSVVAVIEDLSYHWQAGRHGLTPVGYQKRVVRLEKDVVFKEAGGLYAFKTENLLVGNDFLGKRISHIEMAPWEAIRIATPYDYWIAQQLVAQENRWIKASS